jgi:hypothetical protein
MRQSADVDLWSSIPPRLKTELVNLCMASAAAGIVTAIAFLELLRAI